jgi:hypothetical protein
MNFHLLKFLKTAAFMSAISLSLIACGGDDPPSKPGTDSSSSVAPPISSPAATKISPIKINNFAVSQVSSNRFLVTGNVVIDYTDTTVANVDSVKIDNIELKVGLVQDNGLGDVGAQVQYITAPSYPTERVVNFNEAGAYIDVTSFDACGNFIVEVIVYSSSPDNTEYISKETASFSKPAATYCPEPVSSSSVVEEPLIEMDSYDVVLTTTKTSGNVAIDFETGTLYSATNLAANKGLIDAVLVFENGVGILKSAHLAGLNNYDVLAGGNDTKFAEETKASSASSGEAVPAPVYTNAFSYTTPTMSAVEELGFGLYYVVHTTSYNAVTKDGFYAFMVGREERASSSTSFTFTIYKKK